MLERYNVKKVVQNNRELPFEEEWEVT